jgi:nitroreductase
MAKDDPGDRFVEVLRRQRACRRFSADPVPDDLLERLLEAATHAPSAENRQPWVFVVVRSPEVREAIGAIYARAWNSGAREHSAERLDGPLMADVDEGARGGVASAPVLIVVCGDAERSHPQALASSIFPAVQNLLLSASAYGLGSALTTLAVLDRSVISPLLGLPDHLLPMALVPIGWPSRTLGPARREPVAQKAHRDRFGNPWSEPSGPEATS